MVTTKKMIRKKKIEKLNWTWSKNGLIPEVRQTIKKCENTKVKVVYVCIRLLYLMDC